MNSTDEAAFATLVAKTWRFYGKTPTGEDIANWIDLLEGFPLETIATAFKRHLTDPERGCYPPKPADIIRHLPAAGDGRPGPDEAWGLLLRVVSDERETGALTDEMRAGWAVCQPILDAGDEVGARRSFIETYERHVREARQQGLRARWTATLGTDPRLRVQRLQEALEARRIDADQARALLPDQNARVAGRLAGPAVAQGEWEARNSERIRALAAMLRADSANPSIAP